MTAFDAVSDRGLVSPDRVCSIIQRLLRQAQLDGITDEQMAIDTGLAPRRIKSYRIEGKEPSASALLSIMSALGKRRGVDPILAGTIGYVGEPIDPSDARKAGEVVAECAKEFAIIAGAAAAGRFDHTTQPAVQQAADLMIEVLVPLSSVGQAA